ncbi:MAG TPA: aldo/keto reductase [Steroidobacteraceae bacterium]|nr:aldo/keto reductase [Steroidobacteraceae bacterium]
MDTQRWTRRQVLVGGVVGMAGLVAPREAARARSRPALPAAAAGTLRIGGDLTVNRMGFGAMRITGPGIWGEPRDAAEARRVLRRAVELGVDFVDTADAYGPQISERLIAEALHPYPQGLVIATKGGLVRPGPSSWVPDGRPEHLREACEASLKRLQLARMDLYQFHHIDPKVPLEDSIGELARLQKEGKIRHLGVSNFTVEELARARRVTPIVSVQNRYNIADRASADVLAVCEREGLAFIPWAPIARGSSDTLESSAASKALEALAKAHGVSVFQAAIAWLLAKSPAMLPIPGTSSVAHLEEDVAAARIKLSASELAALG